MGRALLTVKMQRLTAGGGKGLTMKLGSLMKKKLVRTIKKGIQMAG
jgi:hypothetical protein